MSYILALDQGTTSSRAIIFDQDGQLIHSAQEEFTQYFPQDGWVEHTPAGIWDSQLSTAREVIEESDVTPSEIAGIGITNQRETTLVWDRETGDAIHNAIVWQDRRTAEFCDELRQQDLAPLFQRKTGLRIDAYFSGPKIKWILDHVEGARKRAKNGRLAFGTVDSWLLWNLTDGRVHATDVTNAGRTMIYNIHEEKWDPELLDILDIPSSVLPEVRDSSDVYGQTSPYLLGEELPIGGIAGDQQAALFGQSCIEPGMAKNTYGTGCFVLMQTGNDPVQTDRLLTTPAWRIDGEMEYALEGSIFVGGAVVQWLRDGLGIIDSASEVEPLARQVDDTNQVYLVPAFVGLGAPHWDPYARGTIIGLTRATEDAHIARAALESIAHQTADVVSVMESESGIELTELRVDGGASANDLLMQRQADFLDSPVIRSDVPETTALGAAYLAGLSCDVWSERTELEEHWKQDARFDPGGSTSEVMTQRKGWKRALERARHWIQPEDE